MEKNLLKKSKILQVVHRLSQERGGGVYLVGGAVRDIFLEKPWGKDFDFVAAGEVSGLAHKLAKEMGGHVFPLDESGGTWRVVIKKGKRKTEVDFSSMQGGTIGDDLRQRDFTINSMAINLKEIFCSAALSPLDPLQAFSDLRRRILRTNSEESLRQDPLRMLRAFRFASSLGFSLEEETLRMIERNKELILRSAWERIRGEFFAALNESRADQFLQNLHQSGLLGGIFPETKGWEGLDQGIHHDFPLLEHAFKTVETAEFLLEHLRELYPAYANFLDQYFCEMVEEGVSRRALFKFVAFFHDSGKPETRDVGPEEKSVRFLDHDQKGQEINILIARRMKLSRKSIGIISLLTRHHMRILSLSKIEEVTPRAKYRFFRDLGKEGIDAIFLALADGLASRKIPLERPLFPQLPNDLKGIKEVADGLLRYYFEEFSKKMPQPLLDGKEIMEILGLPQGEVVGRLLAQLREAEATGKVQTREQAWEFLKNLDRSRRFS
ncbi:MAG: CCA tRNA nucleotidyltransferase [Deltaproteobacteria bacterium]|nr:CCA tRNA nucleotidyltransferase [Deltaproteobacteria bacterium]